MLAQKEAVGISRRDGALFSLKLKKKKTSSPFNVPEIKTKAKTKDILDANRDSRMG